VDVSLREGYARWRELGVRRGTAGAIQLLGARLRGSARRVRLQVSPHRIRPGEVGAAIGAAGAESILRGRVLAAMPTVAEFERGLDRLSDRERADLLARAELIAGHSFDLLGSGPTSLGPRIDWSCDFKTGRCWPRLHVSRIPISYPDDSDIKVPWELSRFQHLPLLAAAHRITGEEHLLEEIRAQLEDWIDTNPVEYGVNWACTMDVAIRAVNWVAALALVAESVADEPWLETVLGSLLLHGRFIRSQLEWAPVRGNHYLSDIVGLLCLSAVFSDGPEGAAWARWSAAELVSELHHQVRPDGCDHEASIPYHRLVTELFVCGYRAAEALVPGAVSRDDREVIDRMVEFVRNYTRLDGLAPQVGDADDGRLLPLGEYGADPRSHLHLFRQWGLEYAPATTHAAFPEGGYWIIRSGSVYVLVRCGDVGLGGQGSHAHNDALSFEFAFGRQPLVIDPGSFVYTADQIERNSFRSTASHSTVQIDDAEQNPLSATALFAMEDRRRAEALSWEPSAGGALFTGRHHGYESLDPPATHTRRFELQADATLLITDTITSAGEHEAKWTFVLPPCQVTVASGQALAQFDSGVELQISSAGLEFYVIEGSFAPAYGRREPTPFIRARRRTRPGDDVTDITLRARTATDG
jgi:uncharacterized heparinase superfamily protein